jgi:hypothetical protein
MVLAGSAAKIIITDPDLNPASRIRIHKTAWYCNLSYDNSRNLAIFQSLDSKISLI